MKNKRVRAAPIGWDNRFHPWGRFKTWWIGGVSFFRGIFRVAAAWQVLTVLLSIFVAGYFVSAFYTGAGEFVISIDKPMESEGFLLSNTPVFKERISVLNGNAVKDADNISIYDIPSDVFEVDGEHNGASYVAYTFYLKNTSDKVKSYLYEISIKSAYKGAENAAWLMVAHNSKLKFYAMPNKAGHAECQFSDTEFPFMSYLEDTQKVITTLTETSPGYITQEVMDYHHYDSCDGLLQLMTTPFNSQKQILSEERKDIGPGEVDKFTVVMWLEGEDPECVDDILGGYIEMSMNFHCINENKNN